MLFRSDYREIVASQSGFDSYDEMYHQGYRIGNGYDKKGNSRPHAATPTQATVAKSSDQIFEERLKQFMSESDSKISSLRQYSDHRTKSRRR